MRNNRGLLRGGLHDLFAEIPKRLRERIWLPAQARRHASAREQDWVMSWGRERQLLVGANTWGRSGVSHWEILRGRSGSSPESLGHLITVGGQTTVGRGLPQIMLREHARMTVFVALHERSDARVSRGLGLLVGEAGAVGPRDWPCQQGQRWWWLTQANVPPRPVGQLSGGRGTLARSGWAPAERGLTGTARHRVTLALAAASLADRARALGWCLGQTSVSQLGWVPGTGVSAGEVVLLNPGQLHVRDAAPAGSGSSSGSGECCQRSIPLAVVREILAEAPGSGWSTPLLAVFEAFLVRERAGCDLGEPLREVLALAFADVLSPAAGENGNRR